MTIEQIAQQIKLSKLKENILIGVEGFGGSGKSTIAHLLSDILTSSHVVSIDDFIIKDHILDNGWDKHAFDRVRLETEVLRPFKSDDRVSYRKLKWESNTLSAPRDVPNIKYGLTPQ